MKKALIVVAVLALAAGAAAAFLPGSPWAPQAEKKAHVLPESFGAYVLNVSDGRTMAISVSNELYMLRVKGIELPTRADAALESELNLRTLVFGRNILVEHAKLGSDNVYEGEVRVGPDHVAEAQVSGGLATATAGHADLQALQETAKQSKVGMWAPPPSDEHATAADQSAPQTAAVAH